MAGLSIFRSFAKSERFSRARWTLAALFCISLGAAALGKSDPWPNCHGTNPEARITACTKILARGSKETKRNQIVAYINRSSAYRAMGDLDRAMADLGQVLRRDPKSPRVLTKRASIYQEKGDFDRAITDYTAAIAAQPKSAAAFHGRGEAYRAKGDLDRAIADFDRELRLDKKLAAAYVGRAKAYRDKGDFDKALANFDEAVRLDPKSAPSYFDRGEIHQAKGNFDQAIADYGHAIERDPTLAVAYNNRGLAFSTNGELDKALADFSAAIERDPKLASAYLNRANAYRSKDDLDHARQDLLAALKLDPQLIPVKDALDDLDRRIAESTAPPAAAPPAHALDDTKLPWPLALPFAGMLLSIALGPLVVKEWWHIHYEKAAAFWAILTLGSLAMVAGPSATMASFVHSMALEYFPFILMLFAFYTAAGGIAVEGKFGGSPLGNTIILTFGTMIASMIGTTGASMVLIRPLIRANSARKFNAHVVVFFIFLVSNIGGVLTPVGDPPLFLGFLQGIDFFWTTRVLWQQGLLTAGTLLVLFLLIDSLFYWREGIPAGTDVATMPLRVRGLGNIALIAIAILTIVASGLSHPAAGFEVFGTKIELQNVIRELVMVLVGLASIGLTKQSLRAANGFEWEPIREVAYLFAGIFICIIPVMAMLKVGTNGPFLPVIDVLTRGDGIPDNAVYFWATGILSSFLDNAPTYLVFFQLAGGDPVALMGPLSKTLTAISLGAVFMGANTYIGNAPNFMVYAIARRAGVNMPGFFSYMIWSGAILFPVFAAVTFLFLM